MNARQRTTLWPIGNNGVYLAFMKRAPAPVAGLLAVAMSGAVDARTTLAVHDGWAAFREQAPPRCFAVARPEADGRARGEAALSVLVPRPGARPQIHVRLTRPRGDGPAFVEIGGRRIALAGRGADLWIADPAANAAVQAAMRGGTALRIRARDEASRPLSDRYPLPGFATALDAAIIGCAPRR